MEEKNWKEMFASIQKREDDTFIQFALDADRDVNALNKYGKTMLSCAAECGNLEIIEFLVQKGADGNVSNTNGSKPLHIAAKYGHKDIVKFFLNIGIFADSSDNDKCTPLHYAAAEVNISFAARESYQELVQLLVNSNADLNAVNRIGSTPLLVAAKNSRKDIIKVLIKLGANVGCCDANQWTLLHHCSSNGWSGIVRSLVEGRFHIDLNARNSVGNTPLLVAAAYSYEEVAELLIESGADVHCQDFRYRTVVHYACGKGWRDIVKSLIKKGSDLNAQTDDRDTPLHFAAFAGNLEIIETLLKAGVKCNVENRLRQTAHNYLIENRPRVKGIVLFLQHGAYFKPEDCIAINETPFLKESILQDVELCTQAVINKFNNVDLPKIYEISVLSELLPSIEKLKIVSRTNVAQDIAESVKYEIKTNGYCNILNIHLINLNSLCVKSLVEYYDD